MRTNDRFLSLVTCSLPRGWWTSFLYGVRVGMCPGMCPVPLPLGLRGDLGVLPTSRASLVAQTLKNLPAMWETQVWSLGPEDPLEKEMATHCSILACRIPWTEEPGGLQSTGSQRVTHDWATNMFTSHWWRWVQRACSLLCFCTWYTVFVPDFSEVAVGVFWSLYSFCP